MTHKIAITGSTGQLGTELLRQTWPENIEVIGVGREDLDLGDTAAIHTFVMRGNSGDPWAAVINAAAYTAVDQAETDRTAAWQINALAPAAFAKACAAVGTPLLHVSTDYVFPGTGSDAWEVGDPVGPLNVYGASKLAGELAIRASAARHAIIRTAWVISAHGRNFVKTMLRLARERDTVRIVADQRGNPTSAADLAAAVSTVCDRLLRDDQAPSETVHFTNIGAASWAELAEEVFQQSRARGGPFAEVEPITSADYPTPATRPANSALGHAAIRAAYGVEPRPWQAALGDILDELIGEEQ